MKATLRRIRFLEKEVTKYQVTLQRLEIVRNELSLACISLRRVKYWGSSISTLEMKRLKELRKEIGEWKAHYEKIKKRLLSEIKCLDKQIVIRHEGF